MNMNSKKSIGYWLLTGALMIVVQVLLGGITRLTGSGLSITEWNLLMGWIPPMNEVQWQEAFNKYQQFPQFHAINQDMTLSGFKWIFFWEYIHRVWARSIGLVFIFPFLFFIYKKWISKEFVYSLLLLFLLGALQGLVGWLMVRTGLKDRPWVSPFSLSIHLSLALITYCYLIWLTLKQFELTPWPVSSSPTISWFNFLIALTGIQIIFGGFMAGSHAALFFPTWPWMNNTFLPDGLINTNISFIKNFVENTTWIQFIHRNTAYLLTLAILYFWYIKRKKINYPMFHFLAVMVLIQVALGITTLLLSVGRIPVLWGVLHQSGAVVLLTILLVCRYRTQES